MNSVPFELDVFTNPFNTKLLNADIFCVGFTLSVLLDLANPTPAEVTMFAVVNKELVSNLFKEPFQCAIPV